MPDPHLAIEHLIDTVAVLDALRPTEVDGERASAYRLVLTDVHEVIRKARDINDGH